MSDNQFRKHLDLFEGFWDSEETAQQIIDSLSEEDVANLTSDEVYRLVDEFVEMGDSPHAADRDEIAQVIMDRLNVEAEVDYGDGMHDRENEDHEEYVEPSGVDSGWNFESIKLSNIVESVLSENGDLADRKQKKLDQLEDKLKAAGYKRSKDSEGGEYQYKWTKDGATTYVVNYRFGKDGYAEFWKATESNIVESMLGEDGAEEKRIIQKLMSKEDKKWNPSTLKKIRDKLREFSRNIEHHKYEAERAVRSSRGNKWTADSYDSDQSLKSNPNWEHNQRVARDAEQEGLERAKRHAAAIVQLKKERIAFLKSLLGIQTESLDEAPKKKMPPRQKVPAEPVDDFEDEFAAPERPVDVGDDIDFEDNIDDLDLDNLGIYVELDDY